MHSFLKAKEIMDRAEEEVIYPSLSNMYASGRGLFISYSIMPVKGKGVH